MLRLYVEQLGARRVVEEQAWTVCPGVQRWVNFKREQRFIATLNPGRAIRECPGNPVIACFSLRGFLTRRHCGIRDASQFNSVPVSIAIDISMLKEVDP